MTSSSIPNHSLPASRLTMQSPSYINKLLPTIMTSKTILCTLAIFLICFAIASNAAPFYLDEAVYEPHQFEAFKLKRAINPFMDSIGKRSDYYSNQPRRYFDVLAGQSLGKRSNSLSQ
uniref:Neuropeptide-Like Protein n=1 Tax=Parastrongyloides trichosuri TaxID=131310 RepID=A0A0N4ZBG9_PARTI